MTSIIVCEDVVHKYLKAAGALESPSGITNHSKELYWVWNAVFHLVLRCNWQIVESVPGRLSDTCELEKIIES